MQQIKNINIENPVNKGYTVDKEGQKENYYKTESHLYKQDMFSGIKAGAHKLTNDVFTYFPKGFSGSKNFNFYEYLSMGMVPYILGSATLIALSKAANKCFNIQDAKFANDAAKTMGAGVILYGLGKWASKKISRTLINASTGVDLGMTYINKSVEIPENGRKEGIIRTQYPGVYDSIEFYRNDLLKRDAQLNHENIFYYDDKVAKKAGYGDRLNSPEGVTADKIRRLKSRAGALENIGQYIAAATGVALGAQKSFQDLHFFKGFNLKAIKGTMFSVVNALKNGVKQLWAGTDRNIFTKHYGKAMLVATVAATLLDWIIPTIAFKHKPNTMKSKIDDTKECEVG